MMSLLAILSLTYILHRPIDKPPVIQEVRETVEEKKPEPLPRTECSCMRYLQEVKGVEISGDAIDQVPNIPRSMVEQGDIILFRDGNEGHAALVEAVLPGGYWISERNYYPCLYTERLIPYDHPTIYGFMRLNNPFDRATTSDERQ